MASKRLVPGITVHSVVKNEPFIYYAIKSVYPYVDKILLYDTGSNDDHTLQDIQTLLSEDTEHKIIFKQTTMDICELSITAENMPQLISANKDKKGKGPLRQQQIDETETKLFMVLDGDEVYCRAAMEKISAEIIPNFPDDMICGFVPIRWHSELTRTFRAGYRYTGRLFRTDRVAVINQSPDERHCEKTTRKIITRKDATSFIADIPPFSHFSSYLKPWRRIITDTRHFKQIYLPEVMTENTFYSDRFDQKYAVMNTLIHNLPPRISFVSGLHSVERGYPWLTYGAIMALEEMVSKNSSVLEVGCGGSTVFFAERCGKVLSLENNPHWASKVLSRLNGRRNVEIFCSNEGNIIRKMTEIENESLDFALIDPVKGEYSRAYQAGLVIPKIKKGGWLILDNYGYENMAEIINPAWRVLTFDDIRWHGNGTRFYQKANQ